MGRARGGVAATVAATRSSVPPWLAAAPEPLSSKPDPLDELLQKTTKRVARPNGSAVEAHAGYLVRVPADAPAALHELPGGTLPSGERVLARRIPPERRRLYGHVYRRLYVNGETWRQSELAEVLTEKDGLTTADLGVSEGRGAVTDTHLREELPEMARRTDLVVVYDAGGRDRKAGLRRPHNRQETRAEGESLRRRAQNIEDGARRMLSVGVRRALTHTDRAAMAESRARVVDAIVKAVGKDREHPRTREKVELSLAEARLTLDDWAGRVPDPDRDPDLADVALREAIGVCRREYGLSIVSSSRGYWLGDRADLEDYDRRAKQRAERVRAHAQAVEDAGARIWPETPDEKAAATVHGVSAVVPWSEHYLAQKAGAKAARDKGNAERKARRKATLDEHRAMASVRLKDLLPEVSRLALKRNRYGEDALTREEARALREMAAEGKAAEKFIAGGPPPKADYAWAPVRTS